MGDECNFFFTQWAENNAIIWQDKDTENRPNLSQNIT